MISLQKYVNLEKGLMFMTEFREPLKLHSLVGKTVHIEQFEFDVIKVDGAWYDIIGYQDGLAHIKESEG